MPDTVRESSPASPGTQDKAGVHSVAMERASNYFRWQLDIMSSHIGSRVLEVGCGIGGFTHALLEREQIVSVDLEPQMINQLQQQLAHQSNWQGHVADVTDMNFPSVIAPYRCDSVVATNVIEHIEDDVLALETIRQVLPSGGTVAVLVPAHAWLYGAYDAAVGHFRRYTTTDLSAKVRRAGLAVDKVFYFNMVGAIGWFVNYRVFRVGRVNQGTVQQVQLFDTFVVPVARRLEGIIAPPFGLSVVCLARVP